MDSESSQPLTQRRKIVSLSQVDKAILRIIQLDGKVSLRQIQKHMHEMVSKGEISLSPIPSVSKIKTSLDRLNEKGVIKYFSAILECSAIGYRELLLMFLRVNNTRNISEILRDLNEFEELNVIYQTSGTAPIFCMAKCVEKEDQIKLLDKIKRVSGIEEITTQVVMRRIKEDMRVRIPK